MATRLAATRVATPLGPVLVACDARSVVALDFAEPGDRVMALLRRRYGAVELVAARDALGVGARLDAYFAGALDALDDLPADGGGTPFQRAVWAALRRIPPGRTTSYGALAASLGRPAAVRAVGHANGANPVSLVVPCHRVIGADGALTGYGGGLERKRWLLRHEGALAA